MNNTPRSKLPAHCRLDDGTVEKSSLVNALTALMALVSATPGTIYRPRISKSFGIYISGPAPLYRDTPVFDDDEGELGGMRAWSVP